MTIFKQTSPNPTYPSVVLQYIILVLYKLWFILTNFWPFPDGLFISLRRYTQLPIELFREDISARFNMLAVSSDSRCNSLVMRQRTSSVTFSSSRQQVNAHLSNQSWLYKNSERDMIADIVRNYEWPHDPPLTDPRKFSDFSKCNDL